MATLSEVTDRIKTAVGDDSGLGKSLKFDLKDAGVIHIDGGTVTNEDKPADLTMTWAWTTSWPSAKASWTRPWPS
jgi:putative sterol carrier protein